MNIEEKANPSSSDFDSIVKAAQDIQKRNPYGSKPHREAYNTIRAAVLKHKGTDIGEY